MSRRKFLASLRNEAKERGFQFVIDKKKGKGSHYIVYVGERRATVPKRVTRVMETVIRKQLGLEE